MDNHPIPQDVTHFQFKLIGNLTLKQFGYVGAGGILAWIAISTGAPFLVKLLFAILFAGSGLIFAFVPIEGRAADLMLTYFFKALFQPNQYLFKKQDGANDLVSVGNVARPVAPTPPTVTTQPMMAQQPQSMPSGMPMMPSIQQVPGNFQPNRQPAPITAPTPVQMPPIPAMQTPQAVAQQQSMPVITSPLDIAPLQTAPMPKPIAPVPPVVQPTPIPVPIKEQPVIMQQQPVKPIQPIIHEAVTPQAPVVVAPVQNPTFQKELQDTLAQKKQLEEQLAQLQKQLEQRQQPEPVAEVPVAPVPPAPVGVSPVIKTIPVAPKVSQAPMVSDFPNIIMGVVKDARGNVLPNILIEVKDTDDNPVRAFKTNQLGQFASATPLLNGNYTILFEDPAKTHNFDAIEIEVTGEIMQPVEVISHDQREDLRKELFG